MSLCLFLRTAHRAVGVGDLHQAAILTCPYEVLLVTEAAGHVSSMAHMGDCHSRMLQQAGEVPFRPTARAFSLSVYYVPAVLHHFLKSTNDMSTGILDQHLQTCKVAQLSY